MLVPLQRVLLERSTDVAATDHKTLRVFGAICHHLASI